MKSTKFECRYNNFVEMAYIWREKIQWARNSYEKFCFEPGN